MNIFRILTEGFMKRYLIVVHIVFLTLTLSTAAQAQDSFLVLSNGDTIYGKVELKKPFLRGAYVLVNDSTKYEMGKVFGIQTDEEYYVRHPSAFNKNRLIRRVEEGNVDLFIDNTETTPTMVPIHTNTPYGSTTHYSYAGGGNAYKSMYFSKNGGDIQKVNHSNLSKALADNPMSQQHLDTYKNFSYAKAGSIVGGIAVIGSSFIGVDKDNPPKVGLIVAGGIIANLGWVFHMMQSDKIESAIREYNSEG